MTSSTRARTRSACSPAGGSTLVDASRHRASAMKFGWVALPDQLQRARRARQQLGLGIAAVGTFAEFFADKIAWVDSAWDAIHSRHPAARRSAAQPRHRRCRRPGMAGRQLPAWRRRGVPRACRQGRRADPGQRQPRALLQRRRFDRARMSPPAACSRWPSPIPIAAALIALVLVGPVAVAGVRGAARAQAAARAGRNATESREAG